MTKSELMEQIHPANALVMEQARAHWNALGKPLYSLGKLEKEIIRIAGMKGSCKFSIQKKALVVMCADNGIVEEGVTQTGKEVTAIVADNFTKKKTSTNHMAEIAGVTIHPIDIGMESDVASVTKSEYKVRYGTRNFVKEPALTRNEVWQAIETGIIIVKSFHKEYDMILTGEMGIGNTTTSSAVACVLLSEDVEQMTGRGAGLDDHRLQRKIEVIHEAIERYQPEKTDVIDVLSKVGGLDLAGLCGVYLGGAIYHLPVVIDGFISSVAALCAARLIPEAKDYMIASHMSGEPAAKKVLDALGFEPILHAGMSLGEGSGAVALMPLLDMANKVYCDMSDFQEIRVEQYEDYRSEK